MDEVVLLLVLLAALTHASWNAWLKDASPNFIGLGALATGWLLTGCFALPFVGLPDRAQWSYLLATVGVHTIYAALLVNAYRHGELSLVFPVARGTGPLIVALVSPWLLQERLAGSDQLAVLMIVAGILFIGLAGAGAGFRDRHAVLLSLATGLAIATYTLIDASGARAGSSPHVYSAWLFLLCSVAQIGVTCVVHRRDTVALLRPHFGRGVAVGVLSAIAYSVVLWAMTVAPAALVAAVRETSILFAALLGWGLLRERIGGLRWIGVMLTVAGLIIERL